MTTDYQDRTPDNIFIKVYPAKLRALAREKGLSRAEIAELVLLACRINEERICWPSKADSASSIGMKSPHWSRKLHNRLRQKECLTWDFDHEARSPRFRLPDAFSFGTDYYQDHNTESRGDHNTESRGDHNTESRGDHNTESERDSTQKSNQLKKISTKSASALTPFTKESNSAEPSDSASADEFTAEHQDLAKRALMSMGVYAREAELLSQQFSAAEISTVLAKYRQNQDRIKNPGGWIRRSLENNAAQLIKYPNSNKKALMGAATVKKELQALAIAFSDMKGQADDPSLNPLRKLLKDAVAGDMFAWKQVNDIATGRDTEWSPEMLKKLSNGEYMMREHIARLGLKVR